MKLRKQLFTAFLAVAMLPLLVVSLYLLGTNVSLARALYEQELLNSTQMQTDLLEEHINRMMVRSDNFSTHPAVRSVCATSPRTIALGADAALSNELLKFTDETLDSVCIFALMTNDNRILYSSGSKSDTNQLVQALLSLQWDKSQTVLEISIDDPVRSLAIATPVMQNGVRVGGFLVVYRSDYFLKTISSHKQLTNSNAFIYCTSHAISILAKHNIPQTPVMPLEQIASASQGSFVTHVNGQLSMCYFVSIPKTPWLLVSTIPFVAMISILQQYGIVSVLVLLLSLGVVFLLSRRQSRRMLRPLEQLLQAVEHFFLSGAQTFPALNIDPKTEIGYLAGKFSGMTQEIVSAQNQLRESTYLYQTLLRASYELRITVFVQEDKLTCLPESLQPHLEGLQDGSAGDRVLQFLQSGAESDAEPQVLRGIVFGSTQEPAHTEVCCNMGAERKSCWYRMLSVPVADTGGQVQRVVLHFEDITDKKREKFQLIRSSQLDPLCGLLNKTAFLPCCERAEKGAESAVFFIDLDRFKQVNDVLGHAAGDEMLVATAQVIRSQFRTTDVLGRYGGDEFVVFAPHMTRAQAEGRARHLVQKINFFKTVPNDTGNTKLHVTASIGVCLTGSTTDLAHALKVADAAMYRAKQSGKFQFAIAEDLLASNTPPAEVAAAAVVIPMFPIPHC